MGVLRQQLDTELSRTRPLPPSSAGCHRCPRVQQAYDTLDEAFNDLRREKNRLASANEENKSKIKQLKEEVCSFRSIVD